MKDKIEQALNWRYATKKYDPNFQLDAETIALLEKSLQLTPSSYGLQPLHFFWIEDAVLREKVKEIAWNQQQIVDAAAVLVICAKNELDAAFIDAHADRMRDERAMEEAQIQGFRSHLHTAIGNKPQADVKVWNNKQAYIALGQLMHTCALLEIDATPMEGFVPTALDELLQLEQQGLHSALICTIGKRADDDKYQHLKKVRRPINSLFTKL
jgi:nitroreductase